MYVLKSSVSDDYHAPGAHQSAYDPALALELAWDMVEMAHDLDHIPPTVNLSYTDILGGSNHVETDLAFFADLAEGQTLTFTADASSSFADEGGCIAGVDWTPLRGLDGVLVEPFGPGGYRAQITIPWQADANRTDVLVTVSDGYYESPPAYITIDQLKESY